MNCVPAGDELHVVHQEHVGPPVLLPELLVPALPDGVDQLVGEGVALDIDHLVAGVLLVDLVGDGVEQMGLAQAGLPEDEHGVVTHARVVRHRPGGGVGKFVGGAHHEPLKGVFLRPRKKIVLLGVLLKAGQLVLGQDDHFKLCGKQLVERVLDQREVAGDDDVPLQAGGTVQDKTRLLQTDGGGVVEPGVPGGGCHVRLHQGGHLFPHFGGGVHGLSSFVSAEWTGDGTGP